MHRTSQWNCTRYQFYLDCWRTGKVCQYALAKRPYMLAHWPELLESWLTLTTLETYVLVSANRASTGSWLLAKRLEFSSCTVADLGEGPGGTVHSSMHNTRSCFSSLMAFIAILVTSSLSLFFFRCYLVLICKSNVQWQKKTTDFICNRFSNTASSVHKLFVIFRTLPLTVLSLSLLCHSLHLKFLRWDMFSTAACRAINWTHTHETKITTIN